MLNGRSRKRTTGEHALCGSEHWKSATPVSPSGSNMRKWRCVHVLSIMHGMCGTGLSVCFPALTSFGTSTFIWRRCWEMCLAQGRSLSDGCNGSQTIMAGQLTSRYIPSTSWHGLATCLPLASYLCSHSCIHMFMQSIHNKAVSSTCSLGLSLRHQPCLSLSCLPVKYGQTLCRWSDPAACRQCCPPG